MDSLPSHPIGVFDSGVGGLTVVRALMERLPFEDIVYFGDTARVPYGVKSVDTIKHFTGQITEFLLEKNVKLLIIACNTMAAVAADVVKQLALDVPVLDVIEAGARNAVAQTRSNAIGVIGTPTTVNSNAYARSIHHLNPNVRVYSQACPLFVPLVEEGKNRYAGAGLHALPLAQALAAGTGRAANPAGGLGCGHGRSNGTSVD